MPMVTVQMFKGRDSAQKTAIAEKISLAISEHAQVEVDAVWVRFEDIEPSDWAIGGRLHTGDEYRQDNS